MTIPIVSTPDVLGGKSRIEGHPPIDEELREMGIDPKNNESNAIDDSTMFE